MSLPAFKAMMTHTINLRKLQRNAAGDFSTISAINGLKGFVQHDSTLTVREKNDTFLHASAIVFLQDNCGIDINHPHWMVDEISPHTKLNLEVLKVNRIDDQRTGKTHHFELICR